MYYYGGYQGYGGAPGYGCCGNQGGYGITKVDTVLVMEQL